MNPNQESNEWTKEVQEMVNRALETFPKSFINEAQELILEPKNNVYFRMEDVKTELDFQCELFAWVSRPIAKGLSDQWSSKVLDSVNELLNTKFTKKEMHQIYSFLGYNENPKQSVRFIQSGYDFSLLKKTEEVK